LVASWPERRRCRRVDLEFDRAHAVDTAGVVRLQSLQLESDNREFGVRYEATNPDWFRQLLGELPIKYSEFVFIDFGSGKGRALMLASEYPFARVVGVEFSPQLVETARRNLERFQSDRQCCRAFELVCADAVDFELPDQPAVLYFYNPFGEPVLRRVLENVRSSATASARPIYAVVTGDAPLGVFAAMGFEPLGAPDGARGHRVMVLPNSNG
jgi:SAM-dependent methyltransferase